MMGRIRGLTTAIGFAAALAAAPAFAQAPPPLPPEAAEIAHCLCLKQSVDALGAEMAAKQRALDGIRQELARLSTEMESERARLDVNNPEAVARFRGLLARRDAAFSRANGEVVDDVRATVERYNGRVSEYNGRCANRPTDPILLNQVQATLSCPPPH